MEYCVGTFSIIESFGQDNSTSLFACMLYVSFFIFHFYFYLLFFSCFNKYTQLYATDSPNDCLEYFVSESTHETFV